MTWLIANWQTVLLAVTSALGGLVIVLKAVAPLTPTEVDNKILDKLVKVVAFLSSWVTPKLPQPPAPPK